MFSGIDGSLLCMRKTTEVPAIEGSAAMKCSNCSVDIWVSPASVQMLSANSDMKAICMECALAMAKILHSQINN